MNSGVSSALERLYTFNERWYGRLITSLVVFPATMVFYQLLNRGLTPRVDFVTALDRAIPFMPWTITLYHSQYVMLLVAAAVARGREFVQIMAAMLAVNFTCYVGFVTLPAHIVRPDAAAYADSIWAPLISWTYAQDGPGNTFPSIHVATTVILAMRMRHQPGGAIWLFWGVLIIASTVTIKQHFVADGVAGAAIALAWHAALFRDTPEGEDA